MQLKFIRRFKAHLKESVPAFRFDEGDPPMRAELFNVEQMEQYGARLARQHITGLVAKPVRHLLSRLNDNEKILAEVHRLIMESVNLKRRITPAGEWLVDNFYLIEDHIRTARRHLPKHYNRELPRLISGSSAVGLPRVYDIAKEVISHGDGRIDIESLARFVKAYQNESILTIGELWAIPIMLRLALIENLRRVAVRVAKGRIDMNLADSWADKMIDILEKDPKSLILVTADMARSDPPMTPPFVSELSRRLQGQNSALSLPITWIEQRLSQTNDTISRLVQMGNQQLAADQVSISNSIASLRLLGAIDWKEFVESLSIIDTVLRLDPAGIYTAMDFLTRDQYRHVIENLSKNSRHSEETIAREVVKLSAIAMDQNGFADRSVHVGYYLVDKGFKELEQKIKIKKNLPLLLKDGLFRSPFLFYTGSIAIVIFLLSCGLIIRIHDTEIRLGWKLLLNAMLLLSTSFPSIAIINWIGSLISRPKPLPRLDLSKGVSPELRTLVVVPSMLAGTRHIDSLVEDLEVRFMANRDPDIYFGLLTDFPDADREELPGDAVLLSYIHRKIDNLNLKYLDEKRQVFYLFHRPRKWNPREKKWMGHERKRGKLSDLNLLIKGRGHDRFSLVIGSAEALSRVKYVITLDTDTELPRDSARQLIATMAHPLNKPLYDKKLRRVTRGYTILQPRVAVSLLGTNKSRYARLFGSEPGIDPYTRTISDIYQDIFFEGSFIGKGIYEVDSFVQVFENRLPENSILSHDMLEGCYSRSGLLSDVLLFEEYPRKYLTDVSRRHRWIRGDWQLLPWLMPYVPQYKGFLKRNPLSWLSWWKLFDNLRRSLVPFALLMLLTAGWTVLPDPVIWTLAVIIIVLIPSLIVTFIDIVNKPDYVPFKLHLKGSGKIFGRHLNQAAFSFVTLPYEAFYSMDAILRTCWRLFVSRENLLEWNTMQNVRGRFNYRTLSGLYLSMWISPLLSLALLIILIILYPASLAIALPVLICWIFSPVLVWWIDKPFPVRRPEITEAQYQFLHDLSRRTWSFFETFVTAHDNWLPPDNFQEQPNPVIAHRTSPTNIGLSLLANLTAYDFGYISGGDLLRRTSNTLETMKVLEKYQGHLYNWYDTQTLKPLPSLYISSVDSGNLLGHLLTLREGLKSLPDQSIIIPGFLGGIRDTLSVLINSSGGRVPASVEQFKSMLDSFIKSPSGNIHDVWICIGRLAELSVDLVQNLKDDEHIRFGDWAKALALQCRDFLDEMNYLVPFLTETSGGDDFPVFEGIPTLRQIAALSGRNGLNARNRLHLIESITDVVSSFTDMKYDFLYDSSRHLQSLGYNVDDWRRDPGYYDLLASEARLSAFVSIALGQATQDSWFALSRICTGTPGEPVLLSWSGSMFEYLMPLIVMPVYENTLLYQACNAAIVKQIEYAKQKGVPWGISESGYHTFDLHFNYQYKAFGVPGLGLKRGLSDDLVIAPYATALALILKPEEATINLERLADEGFLGRYGFYEAIDYTPSRLPRGQEYVVVKSFMAHHLGMSFLSLSNFLLDRPMQKRFESDVLLQASLLLLHEKIPRYTSFHSYIGDEINIKAGAGTYEMPVRVYKTAQTPFPQVNLLSNGRYQVMITNAGGGYSKWNGLAVTRWREDSTCDNWGYFCYIRDAESGHFWSSSYQPTLVKPERYEAIFSEGRAEFRRRDQEIDSHTEIVVSPEDDIELRRVHLTNRNRRKRILDITSYAEVVLAFPAEESTHPAFNNLFVQTQINFQRQSILCSRRPRSAGEKTLALFHLMAVHGAEIVNITYETDRSKFIGRGNSIASPRAMTELNPLSNTEGAVLDPIIAIQYRIILEPEESVTIDMVTGMADTHEDALALIEKYHDKQLANRVFELAWTHGQVVLQQINAVESDAQLYGMLAGAIVFANSFMRSDSSIIQRNRRGQSALWGHSISGDIPVLLVQIEDPVNISLVRQLVQAHAYWRLKGLSVDMVIWIEDYAGYRQSLYEQIMGIIASGVGSGIIGKPGGIFVRSAEQVSSDDRLLFQAVSRVVISDRKGTLSDQLGQKMPVESFTNSFKPVRPYHPETSPEPEDPHNTLRFFNGIGGFTPDGREYIIYTSKERPTPAPWVNVIANGQFGTVITENGQSYTWSENAHEFRLSPWHNDPVTDRGGEAFYIRDEETGHLWSPTPFIKSSSEYYKVRHGFGYSIFEHAESGIYSELCVYVAPDAPLKFSVLKVRNISGRARKITATGYVEWVLGDVRHKTAMHIITDADTTSSALFARNPYNFEFTDRVAFFQVSEFQTCSFTCDRSEFLGRNGSMTNPDAMKRLRLSGKRGAALDPCVAIQIPFDLQDNQEYEIVFILGAGRNMEEAAGLSNRFKGSGAARKVLEDVWEYWKFTLDAVQIETPDPSLDLLVNGWLIYQTLVSRIFARSGYYQSGGAYGFRDQLQDAMALVHTRPEILRDQILLHAGRQFVEGDVQHWWHPPAGRGVRTRCSDDYLWLPLAVCRYVFSTGDKAVLDEQITYLEGRPVNPDEDSYYDLPNQSREKGTLYEHCIRAVKHGLRYGPHGIPLMGSHDWNDGMNKVGDRGKGESIWLGFFLYDILNQFGKVALVYGDGDFALFSMVEASKLRDNLEQHGWDGDWYLRAYFDNGSPLGSHTNPECSIDSISQSWSILSGAGDPGRARKAMEAVNRRLVRRDKALVQLLDPPFDKSDLNPGYIKGYVPGVRENGGQYTHAAIWTAMGFAKMGDNKNAWEILSLINPVNHSKSPEDVSVYKVEPYVMAADVYSMEPHTGRGGWTWYTGSAGWMYRLIVESLLGIRLEGEALFIEPCLPEEWESFKLKYRYRQTIYTINMLRNCSENRKQVITIDGIVQNGNFIPLADDRKEHWVEVSIGN